MDTLAAVRYNEREKTKTETTTAVKPGAAAQTKRYDEAFKQAAVANWIKAGQSGTKIAAELGISYPSLKEWKRRYYGDATPRTRRSGGARCSARV